MGNLLAWKSNGRKRGPAGIALIADARLLRGDQAMRFLRPIFCKRRLKQPILVALGQEVGLLDWNQRYTIYAHPYGMETIAVEHQGAAMLRQLARNSYKIMQISEQKMTP